MSQMRSQAAAGLKPGDSFEITRTFGQAETESFGHLTRDYNPVHYEPEFCREKGLAGLICPPTWQTMEATSRPWQIRPASPFSRQNSGS